ncbi:MAG: cytochrome c [Isosphaeraceae bacterium]
MNCKWIGFAASAGLVAIFSICSGLSAQNQEKKEHDTPLGKIMEKVQKHNTTITQGTRNAAQFKRRQKDVEKSAKELVKLAKDAKPLKEAYLKNAKNETNPQKKWDQIMDEFAKTSKKLADGAGKEGVSQKEAKALFQKVKGTCADCHTVFRVEEDF